MIFGLMTDAKQRVLELERLAFADANRRKQSQGRIWLSRDWQREGFTGEQLRAMRAKNGVGRPPLRDEWNAWSRGAQADQVNGMANRRGKPEPINRSRRRWLDEPPGTFRWSRVRSTSALRKSKQRKGRA